MSYDLLFWKDGQANPLPPHEIAERLMDGEPVAGLAAMPSDAIMADLRSELDSFDLFAFHLGAQHLEATCSARVTTPEDIQCLVNLVARQGCRAYDPQSDDFIEPGQVVFTTPTPVAPPRHVTARDSDKTSFSAERVLRMLGWMLLIGLCTTVPRFLADWFAQREAEQKKQQELADAERRLIEQVRTQQHGGEAFRRLYGIEHEPVSAE